MIRYFVGIAICLSLLTTSRAAAQTTRPSTAPAPRKVVTVPPGFKLVVDGGRNVICQEGDESWVRLVIADKTPTSRPTTMPSDLVEKLSSVRDVLSRRMATDLALADAAAAQKFIDQEMLPLLTREANFRPPVFYLVTTRDVLRQVVKDGWTDPAGRYHYNRAADQVSIPAQLQLSMDGDTDDQVLPIIYQTADDLTARRDLLKRLILDTETQLNYFLSARSLFAAQMELLNFINSSTLESLGLKRDDQQWFGVGVAGVLSSRYLATINGSPQDTFLAAMVQDDRRNPVRSATVNLLNPMNLDDMRPAARPAYADAVRRKATSVAMSWLDRGGQQALPKVIAAIRATPPPDGVALVKIITAQSGIDLTPELQPR